MSKATLYNQDFLLWTQQQAECLKKGRWAELDVEHLVEELETLGRSEQKELVLIRVLKGNSQMWKMRK